MEGLYRRVCLYEDRKFWFTVNYINPLEVVERSFKELCKRARSRIKVGSR